MREGGVWGEVFFDGGALGCWCGLREEVDYVGDIGWGVFHCLCGGGGGRESEVGVVTFLGLEIWRGQLSELGTGGWKGK